MTFCPEGGSITLERILWQERLMGQFGRCILTWDYYILLSKIWEIFFFPVGIQLAKLLDQEKEKKKEKKKTKL